MAPGDGCMAPGDGCMAQGGQPDPQAAALGEQVRQGRGLYFLYRMAATDRTDCQGLLLRFDVAWRDAT